MKPEIAIVGGGLGGLALALALTRTKRRVVVLEAREAPSNHDRWGFTLWPPALRVLDWLGLRERALALGVPLKTMEWRGAHGEILMHADLGALAAFGSFLGVLPTRIERLLYDEALAAGVEIWRGAKVVALEVNARGARMTVEQKSGVKELDARFLVGADGPESPVRAKLQIKERRFSVPGQTVLTGIGGPVAFAGVRQVVGEGWSLSTVPVAESSTWIAAALHGSRDRKLLDDYALSGDRELGQALAGLERASTIAPFTAHVPRWTEGSALLIGDAAHPMVPHLGLGGCQTLEDVPMVSELLEEALVEDSCRPLARFRRARASRVAYAQRVSLLWAAASAAPWRPLPAIRDLHFKRLSRRPELMLGLLADLAGTETPSWETRAATLLF